MTGYSKIFAADQGFDYIGVRLYLLSKLYLFLTFLIFLFFLPRSCFGLRRRSRNNVKIDPVCLRLKVL